MSLTEHRDVEQRSEQWYELRRGLITASSVGALLTPTLQVATNDYSRGLISQLAGERISGRVTQTRTNDNMLRGVLDEPYAREEYARYYGVSVEECGFMVRRFDSGERLGLSPDGLVGPDGLIEIKSRAPKKHVQTVLADAVPLENMAQCQAALLVSGRKWLDYVSYCSGMALWVKRVKPDDAWQEAICLAVEAAEVAIWQQTFRYTEATLAFPLTEYVDHFADVELSF